MATIVKLSKAIQAHGEELQELSFKEPTVAHLRVLDESKGKIDQTIRLISALADIPISSVEQMAAADFEKCDKAIEGFFAVLGGE